MQHIVSSQYMALKKYICWHCTSISYKKKKHQQNFFYHLDKRRCGVEDEGYASADYRKRYIITIR